MEDNAKHLFPSAAFDVSVWAASSHNRSLCEIEAPQSPYCVSYTAPNRDFGATLSHTCWNCVRRPSRVDERSKREHSPAYADLPDGVTCRARNPVGPRASGEGLRCVKNHDQEIGAEHVPLLSETQPASRTPSMGARLPLLGQSVIRKIAGRHTCLLHRPVSACHKRGHLGFTIPTAAAAEADGAPISKHPKITAPTTGPIKARGSTAAGERPPTGCPCCWVLLTSKLQCEPY